MNAAVSLDWYDGTANYIRVSNEKPESTKAYITRETPSREVNSNFRVCPSSTCTYVRDEFLCRSQDDPYHRRQ